jgi:hypothetical protein
MLAQSTAANRKRVGAEQFIGTTGIEGALAMAEFRGHFKALAEKYLFGGRFAQRA